MTYNMNDEVVMKNKIIEYRNKAMNPEVIAKKMNIEIVDVCDALDYSLDPELMMKQHKDFLFYNHGFGDHIESRFDCYGLFLEDGDFEKWQPVCYMDKNSEKFRNLKNEAEKIPLVETPEKEARRLWIMLRFEVFQSKNYKLLEKELNRFIKQIEDCKNKTAENRY